MTAFSPGTRLGPYEIRELLGAGGMGEVYKALDTRLDRMVAVKVLPPRWAENREMKERFEREAQAVASLNHPHICVLHDVGEQDGTSFLVMECLEGETLARRLERGPLELDEALGVAIAIADALDKAHRRGVVHRDLKPSNVMLTPSGPKLLDFGLAKVRAGSAISGAGSPGLPLQSGITTPGAILGTLQYMAPEQLEGLEADARTDIFAFGALVHEMVTGKKAFEGKSQVLLMSAIAASETEALSKSQPAAPAALEHVVRTCLAKDPKDRWQTARDLLAELQWVAGGGAEAVTALPVPVALRKRRRFLQAALAAAALLAAVTAWPASLYLLGHGDSGELRIRLPLATSSDPVSGIFNQVVAGNFALSPDGGAIVYATLPFGNTGNVPLFISRLGSVTPQQLPGTEGATQPFWSADSHWIAFVAGGWLKKVQVSGGVPQNICEVADFFGGAWNAEGTIVFGSSKGLLRVSAESGKPEVLTTPAAPETGHYWPHFLPGGKRYLYLAWSGESAKRTVFAGELGSKDRTPIVQAESKALYADSGFLLFRRENTVVAQPFDARSLKLSGELARVADMIPFNTSNGQASFSVSSNGVLAYFSDSGGGGIQTGNAADDFARQLSWGDRLGQAVEIPQGAAPRRNYRGLSLAPDSSGRIAVHSHDGAGGDIFVVDAKGNAFVRITQDASRDNSSPVWSPDGKWIAYASFQKGKWGIYRMDSHAPGVEELLWESELPKAPMSWSPDGKRLVFWVQDPQTGGDLWMLELDGSPQKAAPLINTMYNETHGQISPDGKWIAYVSDATGNRREIFVRPFPTGPQVYQVSFNGGGWPRWRQDSRELYFTALSNPGNANTTATAYAPVLYAVTVGVTGTEFKTESPRELLRFPLLNPAHSGGAYHVYDMSPDGKRILFLQVVVTDSTTATSSAAAFSPDPPLNLIVAFNWAAALKK
jgi:eukaryotic-like serine/threonine-protein kinase